MKRRELFRRSLLGAVGAALTGFRKTEAKAAVREFPDGYDASQELAGPGWEPTFFSRHQNDTLERLCELIIPETETPGAKAALANRFIDKLLEAERPEVQKQFLESLAFIDGESRKRYGGAFIHQDERHQVELLRSLAYPHSLPTWGESVRPYPGHAHFKRLKGWISRAYYSSEAGMRELGWDEVSFHGDFEGCAHEKGTHR